MSRKTIVITGASDGIGAAAARELSEHGHEVIVVGRHPEKTVRVAGEIGTQHFTADFSDLNQVHRLAQDLLENIERIDVLANNAGGLFGKDRVETSDGHETSFQINVLAPFYLTELLMPRLLSSGGLVINTSSMAHKVARVDLNDLEMVNGYSPMRAYANSKLANLLHAKELAARYAHRGLSSTSFHPGVIASNFSQSSNSLAGMLYKTPLKKLMSSAEDGADTLVWLAEGTPGRDFGSGTYYARRQAVGITGQAQDSLLAAGLWDRLETMTGKLPR